MHAAREKKRDASPLLRAPSAAATS